MPERINKNSGKIIKNGRDSEKCGRKKTSTIYCKRGTQGADAKLELGPLHQHNCGHTHTLKRPRPPHQHTHTLTPASGDAFRF